jgi:hypothetical protein
MRDDQLTHAVARLREQLLRDAQLFDCPVSYRQGVDDALEGVQRLLVAQTRREPWRRHQRARRPLEGGAAEPVERADSRDDVVRAEAGR